MPIIGMSDNLDVSFPRLAKLRKGDERKGNQPGPDKDYFRFVTSDSKLKEAFHAVYTTRPRSVNGILMYPTVEHNFPCWREEWGAANQLKHRCDGKTTVLLRTDHRTIVYDPHPCPGGCRQVGRLKIIIPELERAGYVEAETHSADDIRTINNNLRAIAGFLLSVRDTDSLEGIPIVLSRVPIRKSIPITDKRISKLDWALVVELSPRWLKQAIALLSDERRYLLPRPAPKETLLITDQYQYEYEQADHDEPYQTDDN